MRSSQKHMWRLVILCLFAMSPWLMAAQCWDKIQNATINIDIDRSVEFDLDIDKYASSNDKLKNVPDGKLPQGSPDVSIPVDIKQEVDIRNDPNVQKYGNKLGYVKVRSMKVMVQSNTCNIDVPRIDIKMGDVSATPNVVIGYLSGIPASQTPSEDVIKDGSQTSAINSYLLKFAFGIGASTTLIVKAGTPIPKGKIKVKVQIQVTFGLQPFK